MRLSVVGWCVAGCIIFCPGLPAATNLLAPLGSACLAGPIAAASWAPELQDGSLGTRRLLYPQKGKPQVLEATLAGPQKIRQIVFDFVVYTGDAFVPAGKTRLEILGGGKWTDSGKAPQYDESERETLSPLQRFGRIRWLYNLAGEPIEGARLVFDQAQRQQIRGRSQLRLAQGAELVFTEVPDPVVVCAEIEAYAEIVYASAASSAAPVAAIPRVDSDLVESVPCTILFGRDTIRLPATVALDATETRLSLSWSHPCMTSRVELHYRSEAILSARLESFVEGERVRIDQPRLRAEPGALVFSLAPVAVDRIDLLLRACEKIALRCSGRVSSENRASTRLQDRRSRVEET